MLDRFVMHFTLNKKATAPTDAIQEYASDGGSNVRTKVPHQRPSTTKKLRKGSRRRKKNEKKKPEKMDDCTEEPRAKAQCRTETSTLARSILRTLFCVLECAEGIE